jgi:CubicO group peptidase (beta-lactamase class C family)
MWYVLYPLLIAELTIAALLVIPGGSGIKAGIVNWLDKQAWVGQLKFIVYALAIVVFGMVNHPPYLLIICVITNLLFARYRHLIRRIT